VQHLSGYFVTCLLALSTFGLATAMASDATTALTVNGSAKIETGAQDSVLWLTPADSNQAGSAFTTNAVAFGPRYLFATFFQFQMTNSGGSGAADGIVFVLQTDGATALGGTGGNEGYGGITPSVGVEFDTYYNAGIDINDNHVAILTDGQLNDADSQTPYGVTNCQPPTGVFGCMANGDVWSVWIDYDGASIHVALADNSTTRPADLISYPIDIRSVLGQDSAFVGFTAATAGGWDNHLIAHWQFR
jgi:hypothetical protein